MRSSRHSNSWTTVAVPSHPISECILRLAEPVLLRLGPTPSMDDVRVAIALTVRFWNASVLASHRWEKPNPRPLNELRKLSREGHVPCCDAATFDRLAEDWLEHWLDPRLVESWSYENNGDGVARLVCTATLPEGVRAEEVIPIARRIGIGGVFVDEVRIAQASNTFLGYPVERHRSVIHADGRATIYTMMPTALQLFAAGHLLPVRGGAVELLLEGRRLEPMVLIEVRCGGDGHAGHEVAVLVFEPASVQRHEGG
jgi:hypothetical protein